MAKKTNEQFLSEIKIRCKSCNNVWFNSPTHLLSGQGCPYCAGKHKHQNHLIMN